MNHDSPTSPPSPSTPTSPIGSTLQETSDVASSDSASSFTDFSASPSKFVSLAQQSRSRRRSPMSVRGEHHHFYLDEYSSCTDQDDDDVAFFQTIGSSSSSGGSSFQKKYTLLEELGHGGFGFVYRCLEKATHRTCAVKLNINVKDVRSVQEEFTIISEICYPYGHTNIVNVVESICDGTIVYNVFELVSGGDLASRLDLKGFFEESFSAEVMHQVFNGLSYVHNRGYLHRDIKPPNLLLLDSSFVHIKITDFGLAVRRLSDYDGGGFDNDYAHYIPARHGHAGTVPYMCPEAVKQLQYDYECDTWSCGIVLYELLCGYSPITHNKEGVRIPVTFPMPEWRHLESGIDLIKALLYRPPSSSTGPMNKASNKSTNTISSSDTCPVTTTTTTTTSQTGWSRSQGKLITVAQAMRHEFFAKRNNIRRQLKVSTKSALAHYVGMKRLKDAFRDLITMDNV